MTLGLTATRAIPQPQAEYVIYSFIRGSEDAYRRGADPWQHMGSLSDIAQARERARSLFRSARYSRIELRKKFINENGAAMDVALEVLDHNAGREIRNITLLLGAALGCAMLALGLSLTL